MSKPPKFAETFLKWFLSEELAEEVMGDLSEAHKSRTSSVGKLRADLWYMLDVVRFCRPYSLEKYSGSKQYLPMFSNYFKIALRNMVKKKSFTLINIAGLCLGLTAVLLVGMYVHHESSYDQGFPGADRTFRLANQYRDQVYAPMLFKDFYDSDRSTQLRLINQLKSYEEVENACHFITNMSAIGSGSKWYVEVGEKVFVTDDFLITNTGQSFHQIFPQIFLQGSAAQAFSDYQKVVLTEDAAVRFFGRGWRNQQVVGSSITVQNEVFEIGGIVENVSGNTHFDFEILLHQDRIPSWAGYTYFMLADDADPSVIQERLNAQIDLVYPGYTEDILSKGVLLLPLTAIHFTEGLLYELKPTANQSYLVTFSILGFVILLIIWTNYANLSIAAYVPRQKELGVRKVMGALGADIRYQILIEAILMALICFPLVWFLLYVALPVFNEWMNISIDASNLFQLSFLSVLFALLLLTGLVSGLYPALVYSKKSMLLLFKSKMSSIHGKSIFQFKNVLLTFQFFMIVGLMSLAWIILQQLSFIQNRSTGYETDGIVFFPIDGAEKFGQLKTVLDQNPEIQAVGSGMIPGQEMYNQTTYKMKESGVTFSDGTSIYTSIGAMEVYDIQSSAFEKLKNGSSEVFVINETAARKLSLDLKIPIGELIGKTLLLEPEWENENGFGIPKTIADVIPDFDYFTLKYDATPLFLEVRNSPEWAYNVVLRANTKDWSALIGEIENAYAEVEKERPFDLTFFDAHLGSLYQQEENAGSLATTLTFLCLVLSIMGLVGIVRFTTLTKQKEIGVRRVFGASVLSILQRISREYLLMLTLAIILAAPVALWLSNIWLASFAYRIEPNLWYVLFAGLAVSGFVFAVVILQSYKSANTNPAEILKYE